MSGAWRTVKEQMPTRYAAELADRGFAALAFDFRGWGASAGRPRAMEDPFAKADDIAAAVRYLASRPDVDSAAIGGLGICAGAAYTAAAATRTDLIASLALVAPALPSRDTVQAHLGGEPGIAALLAQADKAQRVYAETGKEDLVPAVERTPGDTEPGYDYFTDPAQGAVPAWDNIFNPASWSRWLDFDAQASAAHLTQPLLLVHSEAAASPESVREFADKVPYAAEQLWLKDVTQFSFHHHPAPVRIAADAVATHFTGTMPAPATAG